MVTRSDPPFHDERTDVEVGTIVLLIGKSAVPLRGGVQSQTEDTLTAMGVMRCFKRHSSPGPPAQAGPVRCIILPYLRHYRTYAYTYICNVLSGTVWHAVYRLRNVRWPASSSVPTAQAGPVRCVILPYLRYYRTYAYTYKGICTVVWYCLACRVPAAQRAVACLL